MTKEKKSKVLSVLAPTKCEYTQNGQIEEESAPRTKLH